MYYGLIGISVIMFGFSFFFNGRYESEKGGGIRATIEFSLISAAVGGVILFFIDGLRFEFTWFSFAIAMLSALNGIAFTFCSMKALGRINLSLYSLFSMLGGMALPFVAGICFFEEELTLAKGVCFVIITVALAITVKRGDKKGGFIYYAGIFVLNGMSGVLSKIFQASSLEKTSDTGFSLLAALLSVGVCLISLLFLPTDGQRFRWKPFLYAGGNGVFNRVANLFLLIALSHVSASAQYPLVTGGVMIVSTVISAFTSKKPTSREIAAVILSFIGIIAMVLIPI